MVHQIMPQLEGTYYISQIFWLCVCFGFLWLFMNFWVMPTIIKISEQRKKKIANLHRLAEQHKEETRVLLEANHHSLEEVRQEVVLRIQNCAAKIAESMQDAQDKTMAFYQHSLDAMKEEMAQQAQHVLRDAEKHTAELVELCIQRYVHRTPRKNTKVNHD